MTPANFGTIASKAAAGGSGYGQLTTSYTRGNPIAHVAGLGPLCFRCTVAIVGVTTIEYRVMDYTDASNPRLLITVKQSDTAPQTAGVQQSSASEKFDLLVDLGGCITDVALEAKYTGGVPGATDTFSATLDGWEAPR